MFLKREHVRASIAILTLLASRLHAQQLDPIHGFCRRFAHQTTLIDNRLFIDGGLVNYGGSVTPTTTNYTNTYLLYADLNVVTQNFPTEYANLSKPANVPSVQGGILWADTINKIFYLYGGEYNWTTAPPAQYNLWAYDAVYNTWNASSSEGLNGVQAVSFGAGVAVDDRALGFYYGGWLSNASVLGWNGNRLAQPGLLRYDMIANSWSNNSFYDNIPRAEGVMVYIPASDAGMLVYFGGVQQMSNGSYTGVPMNQIYLYDIASGKSYKQTTNGTAPGMRRRFCAGVSWPTDQSSYNIYFYGGLPPYDEQGLGYGDVWILSIPSFTWIQWYPSANEHHSLSCNVINEGQMNIMGGYFPNSTNTGCDSATIWGQHNLNLGANDVADAEWYQYLPNVTTYQVPSNITQVVGGSKTGGATLTTPPAGWGDPDLAVYFGRQYSSSTRTATRSFPTISTTPSASAAPSSHSDIAAIAGGVVGGIVGLILLILLIWLCLRHRRRNRTRATTTNDQTTNSSRHPNHRQQMTELPNTRDPVTPVSQHKRYPSNPQSSLNSPPPPSFHSDQWSQPQQHNSSPPHQQQHQYGANISPPQQYYPPPPQTHQYYPPPPAPERYEGTPDPVQEMPSVRSPMPGVPE
ncbi:hypothetical protein LTR78_008227 [Recurvomyces mirabilis]|uniref:Cell wall anchored protein n=1 Tax=Recurvomyces mirabilis TaxID=574656 RepID=A0AAE0TRS3_9PEZI|nr:hypothetical protein LTR78_008227 [Recurvomyces mirabilis]KAK5156512.1 hypothetical protein LTS14_004724 [Recurvomyces mirabilis]